MSKNFISFKLFRKYILFVIIFFLFFSKIKAQTDDINIGEELIYNQDFNRAITFYKEVIELHPNNPDFRYKLGFCYLNTVNKRDSSIAAFEDFFIIYNKMRKKKT